MRLQLLLHNISSTDISLSTVCYIIIGCYAEELNDSQQSHDLKKLTDNILNITNSSSWELENSLWVYHKDEKVRGNIELLLQDFFQVVKITDFIVFRTNFE